MSSTLMTHVLCRDFVMSTYQELKKANPRLPILVRECEGAAAKLIARYGKPYSAMNFDLSAVSLSAKRGVLQILDMRSRLWLMAWTRLRCPSS